MAGTGLGRRVALEAVAEGGAFRQPTEAAEQHRPILVEQVARQLIDGNYDHQPRRSRRRPRGSRRLRASSRRQTGEQQCRDQCSHSHAPHPLSFARSRSLTICGLALPAIAFITWPTKKPNNASLPALYCSTLSALPASTSSTAASIAPLSEVCLRPRASTMSPAPSPVSSMISNTCLARLPEMVPSATSLSNSA